MLTVSHCEDLSLVRLVFTSRNTLTWLLHCASVLYAPQSQCIHAQSRMYPAVT